MAHEPIKFGKHIQDWVKQLHDWCSGVIDDIKDKIDTHVNDAAKHGLGVLDYTNGVLVDVSTITEQNPFVAPSAGELVGVFAPRTILTIAYAVINGTQTSYRSSNSSDYGSNRDCYSIKLYTGDELYFTSPVGGDNHYFYPYVNQKIVNLTGDDMVSSETFNAHINDTNLHHSGVPIGTLIWWTGTLDNKPEGYLVADGTTFDAITYPELYAVYGNKNILPNYIGRFVKGSNTAGVSQEDGLPNITGYFSGVGSLNSDHVWVQGVTRGAFYHYAYEDPATGVSISESSNSDYDDTFGFDASEGTVNTNGNYMSQEDSPYGKSDTVTPENTSAIPLIRAK